MRYLVLALALVSSLAANAADKLEGQRCRPLGPLKATDKVNLIARCGCESLALMAGSAFYSINAFGSTPKNTRDWAENPVEGDGRSFKSNVQMDANFVTLTGSTRDEYGVKETYIFWQADDGESVEQFKLQKLTVRNSNNGQCYLLKIAEDGID